MGLLLTGCAGTAAVDAPRVTGSDARACAALVRTLPDRVADQPRVRVETAGGYGAAWGDPAIELRCGVPAPAGFRRISHCQNVNGVDWFVPESQEGGRPVDVTMTTVGRAQNVEVRLPEEYFPPAAAMVDLAGAVRRSLRVVRPCI